MAKKELKIQLRTDGNMLHPYGHSTAYVTVPNTVWKDRLEYVKMVRGSSFDRFEWRSLDTGKTYYMFPSTLDEILRQASGKPAFTLYTHTDSETSYAKSILSGNFTFEKKGRAYGVRLLTE